MLPVSDTAYAIAVVRAEEREKPREARLFDDPFAALFREAPDAEAREGVQRLLGLSFMREGVRLRTRFIDDVVCEGLAGGCRQLLLLGAGFDARALRIPEVAASGARVYEVDFEHLLDRKREVLLRGGVPVPAHVAHVACDFAQADFEAGLVGRLEAAGFRRDADTLVIWEGVVGYLDDAAIARTLGFAARTCGPGSRIVFDYSDYRFGKLTAADRVIAAGFSRFESVGLDELARRHLGGEPHPSAAAVRMGVGRR